MKKEALELSKELKISNKVQDNNGFIFDVVSIFEDGTVYCDFEGNEGDVWEFDNNNPCQGIPLTEEILLKCGFDKRSDGHFNMFKHSEVDIIICNDFSSWQCDGINFSVNRIKYIHQLQNLYWCLCGKELNFE